MSYEGENFGNFTKQEAKEELAAYRDPNYRNRYGHPYGSMSPGMLAHLRKIAGETGGSTKRKGKSRSAGYCSKCKGPHVHKHGRA